MKWLVQSDKTRQHKQLPREWLLNMLKWLANKIYDNQIGSSSSHRRQPLLDQGRSHSWDSDKTPQDTKQHAYCDGLTPVILIRISMHHISTDDRVRPRAGIWHYFKHVPPDEFNYHQHACTDTHTHTHTPATPCKWWMTSCNYQTIPSQIIIQMILNMKHNSTHS